MELLQQLKDRLRGGVGLGQSRNTGLELDRYLSKVRCFRSQIGIPDLRLRGPSLVNWEDARLMA